MISVEEKVKIKVNKKVVRALKHIKKPNETYADVVKGLLKAYKKSKLTKDREEDYSAWERA